MSICPSGTNTFMSMTSTTSTPMRVGKGRNRMPILTGTRRSVIEHALVIDRHHVEWPSGPWLRCAVAGYG